MLGFLFLCTFFNTQAIWNITSRLHFFKSFCDYAKCNLNIKSEGENEHHKIDAVYKAFAKAIKAKATATCDGKYVKVDGIKYKLVKI